MKCYPSAMAFWGLSSGWVMVRSRVVALFLLVVLCLAETEGFKPYLLSGTRWSYLAGSDVGSSFSWVWPDCLSRKASEVSWLSLPVAAPHPRLLEELKICHKSCVRWTMDLGLAPLLRLSVSTLVSSLVCSRRLPVWLVNDFSGVASSIAKRFSSLAARFEDVSFLWLMLMKYRLINFDELGVPILEVSVLGVSIDILVTGVCFVPLSINDLFSLSSSPSSMAFSFFHHHQWLSLFSFTAFILLLSPVATAAFLLQLFHTRFRRLSYLREVLGFLSYA
ncbi:hypothetical protein F2Q68_00014136 [Brassica cretica]|uniref:Uncharacterized protein n=1 Tax=Brassica cretica TaxID=69181 RepID=A0A8S9HLI8_BRACR|nr:hypothetical protein F2Q68_00014136 [Brassica cretica]